MVMENVETPIEDNSSSKYAPCNDGSQSHSDEDKGVGHVERRTNIKRPPSPFILFKKEVENELRGVTCSQLNKGKRTVQTVAEQWAGMTDSEKAVYIARFDKLRDDDKCKHSKCGYKRKERDVQPLRLHSRGSPALFHDISRHVLRSDQKTKWVEELGFRGLLQIRCRSLRHDLCLWLVEHFNPILCRLEFDDERVLPVRQTDVGLVLGIPSSGKKVVLECQQDVHENKKISISLLANKLKEDCSANVFKWIFWMLSLGSLLAPSSRNDMDMQLFKKLSNCHKDILNYNWAEYVLDYLCLSLRKYKENKTTYVCGCIFFLMIFYLDRIDIGPPQEHRAIPRIKAWTKKAVSARLKCEFASGKGFGYGQIRAAIDASEMSSLGAGPVATLFPSHCYPAVASPEHRLQCLASRQRAESTAKMDDSEENQNGEEMKVGEWNDEMTVDVEPTIPDHKTFTKKKSVKLMKRNTPIASGTYRLSAKSHLPKIMIDIAEYCWSADQDMSERLVDMHDFHLTRHDLFSLRDGAWVDNHVVTMAARADNNRRHQSPSKRHIFDPDFGTALEQFKFGGKNDDHIASYFMRYFDKDITHAKLQNCNMLLVPFSNSGHWVTYVINMSCKAIELLDPRPSRRIRPAPIFVFRLKKVISLMLLRVYGLKDHDINSYTSHRVDVPCLSEESINDSGVYLIKYLHHWYEQMQTSIMEENIYDYRIKILAELVMNEDNKECARVLSEVNTMQGK